MKKVVEKVIDKEEYFRDLTKDTPKGILFLNMDSMILYQNEVAEKMSGFSLKERKSKPGYAFIHPDDQAETCELWTAVLNNPKIPFLFQFRIRTKGRKYIWIGGSMTNNISDSSINAIVVCCRDINKRKQTELNLEQSENKYREIFEKMADGVYRSSHEGRFLEVNNSMVSMLGYSTKEELLSIDIKKQLYFAASDRDIAVTQDLEEGTSLIRLRKKDGSEIWVEDRGQYVYDEEGNTLYHEGILRDVTKRILAEINLKESIKETENYRNALNQSLIISTTDESGVIQFANSNLCKLSGYNKEELEGKHHPVFNSGFHSEEFIKELMNTIHSGNVWRGELKDKNKNGEIYWLDCTIVPFKEESGKPYMFLGIAADITMQRELLEELTVRYSELKKINTELDRFVYSVTHDLRAPLSSMMGVIEIATDECRDENLSGHLDLIKGSVTKLDDFIKDILDYSINSRSKIKVEEIDFTKMVQDIIRGLKHMGENYSLPEFKFNLNEESPFMSDKMRLDIIINNLMSNAIRYQDPLKQPLVISIDVKNDGQWCTICIEDNGIGISQENQEKIFEIFYRVSDKSIGSGLGLYIVKEAVEKLSGEMSLTSELGKGSTFTIRIPQMG